MNSIYSKNNGSLSLHSKAIIVLVGALVGACVSLLLVEYIMVVVFYILAVCMGGIILAKGRYAFLNPLQLGLFIGSVAVFSYCVFTFES